MEHKLYTAEDIKDEEIILNFININVITWSVDLRWYILALTHENLNVDNKLITIKALIDQNKP